MLDGHTEVATVLNTAHTLVLAVLDVLIINRFLHIQTLLLRHLRITTESLKLYITVSASVTTMVCGYSLAGMAGSNPAGNIHVCLL